MKTLHDNSKALYDYTDPLDGEEEEQAKVHQGEDKVKDVM